YGLADRFSDRYRLHRGSLIGWFPYRKDPGGLAGNPVLPGGMAAWSYSLIRSRNTAEKRHPKRQRLFGYAATPNGAALLVHSIKVVDRTRSFTQGLSVRDCGRNVGLGQKGGLRQPPLQGQMAGHGGRECAAGAMG